jgi:hypothetical protein
MLLLYLILLIGSFSLGMEALVLGMGGRIIPLYRKRPFLVLGASAGIGFATVAFSFLIGAVFGLEPLYVCALLFLFTAVFGGAVAVLRPKFEHETRPLPKLSDQEVKQILKKRGFKV